MNGVRTVVTPAPEDAVKAIVPRAEFRVFGHGVVDIIQQRMWGAGAMLQLMRKMPAETYVLSRRSDSANVKMRGGCLDIKLRTGETPAGYEIFQPTGKFSWPLTNADIERLREHLNVSELRPLDTLTPDALVEFARAHPDLAVAAVEKTRYGFTVDGVICEYALVLINGARIETACCESEDPALLAGVIEKLGLSAFPNTSYIKALKRVVGLM